MVESSIETALAVLDRLTPFERQQVDAALSMRKRNFDLNAHEQVVYDHLYTLTRVRLTARELLEKYKFRDAVKFIYAFVEPHCTHLTEVQMRGLVRTCMTCLSDYLVGEKDIPVTPREFFNNIENLAYAVDLAFPGYTQARLLGRLVPAAA